MYVLIYTTDLGLKEGIGQLWVVEKQLSCLLWVALQAPLHLLHELKHLLWREAGHRLRDGFRC